MRFLTVTKKFDPATEIFLASTTEFRATGFSNEGHVQGGDALHILVENKEQVFQG